MAARRIVIVAFDDVQALDVTGPLEVFSTATRLGSASYECSVVGASSPGPVTTSSGLPLAVPRSLSRVRRPIDTLVVAGGLGVGRVARDPDAVRAVRAAAARSRRVTSVCTGAFVLAAAGLLDGRRATTHWASCDRLAERYPSVTVEPDPIFVRDGDVWTSAGVTAGMDLALALVADDHGSAVALDVARWLVLFVQRPGGQAQFSAALAGQVAVGGVGDAGLRALVAWIASNPAGDLSVGALAARASMSPRHFARVFRREVGTTPADHVEAVRVEAARALLSSSPSTPLAAVAARCGFGTVETLHHTFARRLGVSPGAYRSHFRSFATVAEEAV